MSKKPRTVAEAWEKWKAKGNAAGADEQLAFYAGAYFTLEEPLQIAIFDDDVDDEKMVEYLEGLRNEIDLFFVQRGERPDL